MDATFEAIACPLLLDEVRRGLAKPCFRDRLPTEDDLVALATTARARAIVTGDKASRPRRPRAAEFRVALARPRT